MENRKMILIFLAGAVAAALVVLLVPRIFSPGKATEVAPPAAEGGLPPALEDLTARIADLKRNLEANPNDVGTLVQLGNLNYDSYQAQGVTRFCTESIRYYEKGLALKPGDPNVLTDLGYMYRCNGQLPEAVKRFREAIKAGPTHPQSRMNLAITLFYDLKDTKGARAAAEELIRIRPDENYVRNAELLIVEIDKAEAK